MRPDRSQMVENLCRDAMAMAPRARAEFLARRCNSDAELLQEVLCRLDRETATSALLTPADLAGRTFSHFRILEKIGQGGMGMVYKAFDLELERVVALKFLPPAESADEAALARLRIEAKAASSLDHPNICTIFEIASTPAGATFIAMAYYEGETVQGRLRRGPLAAAEAVEIAEQVAHGLAKAHSQGIVHRDIKPSNITITKDGVVKLLDFGLAKITSLPSITRSGTAMGTCQYMSPEQAQGDVVDHRTDIWSWGAVLFQMLTGLTPFRGENQLAVLRAIVYDAPDLAPLLARQTPPHLVHVISRALTKSRLDRYQTMAEALADLRDADAGRSTPSRHLPEPPATPTSIAVLPFRNSGGDPENDYFSEGLAEELINSLTRLEGLQVASRSSSFACKNSTLSMVEIGEKLRVGLVLEGSVRRAGNRLRVTVQLIDAIADRGIWSERYDRELADVFAIQEEIAASIVQKLRVRLSDSAPSKIIRRYTDNLEAFNLYLRGRYQYNRATPEALLKAVEAFEQAAAQDPNYVLPYCGIGDCYVVLGGQALVPPLEAWKKLHAAAERAIQLDPTVAEAHACMGAAYATDFNWEAAEREFLHAIELDPDCANAHSWYALSVLSPLGRSEEAIRQAQVALKLEPLSLMFSSHAAWLYYLGGRPDLAVEQCAKTLEMEPNHVTALWCQGSALRELGRLPEAMAVFQKVQTVSSDDPIALGLIGHFYAATGKTAEAGQVLETLRAKSGERYVSPLYFVWIHAALGQFDEAFQFLDAAYQNRDFLIRNLRTSPGMRPLLNDRRFDDLVRKLGLDDSVDRTRSMTRRSGGAPR